MPALFIPKQYKSLLDLKQTEKAIKLVKDFFQQHLATELNLYRVTAPLFVEKGTGINDDLNGIEQPVGFNIRDIEGINAEIVQSLAKWKRMALADLKVPHGYGIYTDMNAIRPDEIVDNLHSVYVDQWDWEKVINAEERNLTTLKTVVRKIYASLKRLEFFVYDNFSQITPVLPNDITFIHSEEAEEQYPNLSPQERETLLAKEHGAIFIIGIGHPLASGKPHDGRAPDYDDWTTETINSRKGLNGDIVLWNPVLNRAFEISSMGIRVDCHALLKQLAYAKAEHRKDLLFHKRLLNNELPFSIGGGIGQSRICMHFLRKAHIGEVQSSIWPQDMRKSCKQHGIHLL